MSRSASSTARWRMRISFSASVIFLVSQDWSTPLGAVQKVLLPGNGNDLDAPARLSELVPKVVVRPSPGLQFARGSHAGVDVGENGPVLLDSHGHLDVEIPDAAIGPASVDSFRKQLGVDPELLEAGDFLCEGNSHALCHTGRQILDYLMRI